ncbi:1-hydroxycarotenoid 3,4-desaturase CrtD [Ascidiimonas aurantiaca]|uniref:1-hydroxycarotenoid 3,4-desaturase CrtD n=1 Tax=Ascidiimonas aurantiaca TaxID=1685432 RepID=UPI0030EED3FC
MKKVIVIGSGVAGLATAVRLRNAGFAVDVFEANSYPGGKLSQLHSGAYRFDAGPSLFTMPQFVDELFTICGKDPRAYFDYLKKDIVCRYFYEDGTRFTAYANAQDFAHHAEEVFDVKKQQVLNYFAKSKKKYDLTAPLFLEKSLHRLSTYLNKETIKALARLGSLDIYSTLHEVNTASFSDTRLVQLFNRFATYNGSSPYLTPGIMSMIPHLEQYFGTFFPKKGMNDITMSIYKLAKELGVNFQFDHRVSEILIEGSEVSGIKTENGIFHASIVVSNMDVVPTYRTLLKTQKAPEKILRQERSSSALIFYWGIKKEFPELDLHNIFFSADYEKEFACIFNENRIYHDPTVYINISSKEKPDDAPPGSEAWFVMINAPGNKGQDWERMVTEARKSIIKKLSSLLKTDIASLIETEEVLSPPHIEEKTASFQGSLYGAASNNRYAAFLRHPNFSQHIKNLYFCGGSVHPGGGIPLCLLSGKIVSQLVTKKHL